MHAYTTDKLQQWKQSTEKQDVELNVISYSTAKYTVPLHISACFQVIFPKIIPLMQALLLNDTELFREAFLLL